MMTQASGAKGLKTEELVRAYFLRAGFFVLRGVKLRHSGEDLTDIDLWIYERSTTLARRRTIIDIKDKKVPQAAERLFFAKGLANILGVEGAGVATTDNRPFLREMARNNGVLWIDGADLQRLKSSDISSSLRRLSEEDLALEISRIDNVRRGKDLRSRFDELRSAVIDSFGPPCANIALEAFQYFAREAITAYPNSDTARMLGRLCFVATAIAAASIDYSLADVALRPTAERVRFVTDLIRFGGEAEKTLQNIRWTEVFIREYFPSGQGLAQAAKERLLSDFRNVPAESVAELVVKLGNSDKLFHVANQMENAAYQINLPSFDQLNTDIKVFLGAMLDFSNINRQKFAEAWIQIDQTKIDASEPALEDESSPPGKESRSTGEQGNRASGGDQKFLL